MLTEIWVRKQKKSWELTELSTDSDETNKHNFPCGVVPYRSFIQWSKSELFKLGKYFFIVCWTQSSHDSINWIEREMLLSYMCTWQRVQNTNSLGNVLQTLDQQQLEKIFWLWWVGEKKKSISVPRQKYIYITNTMIAKHYWNSAAKIKAVAFI